MSSFTENQIIAAILGEAAMIFLLFIDSFNEIDMIKRTPVLSTIFSAISPKARFADFASGIFSLSDLIFYISFIAVILCFTMISIEKRRWSRG